VLEERQSLACFMSLDNAKLRCPDRRTYRDYLKRFVKILFFYTEGKKIRKFFFLPFTNLSRFARFANSCILFLFFFVPLHALHSSKNGVGCLRARYIIFDFNVLWSGTERSEVARTKLVLLNLFYNFIFNHFLKS
jgi:hypothetical protein